MEVKDIIRNRRLELDLTMKQLAEKIGVSEGTISRWESGDIANMKRDKIRDLAKALNLSIAAIMELDEPDTHKSQAIRIPVLGKVIAGTPTDAIENIIDYEEIPGKWSGEYGALRVKGNSMEPRICEGDTLIVRLQSYAESGDIVVAMVNGGEATVKKLIKHPDGITLQPFNPAYEPLYFSNEQIKNSPVVIWGKVIQNRQNY